MVASDVAVGPADAPKLFKSISALSIAIVASIIIAAAGVAAIVWQLPTLNPTSVAAFFALSLAPSWITLVLFGLKRANAPFYAIIPLSVVSLAAGAGLVAVLRTEGAIVDDLHVAALLLASQPAALLGLWVSLRTPHEGARPVLPTVSLGGLTLITLVGVAALAIARDDDVALAVNPVTLCTLYVIGLIPALGVNWCQARRAKRIPVEKTDKQPNHISGMSAGGLIVFVIVILSLGLWAAAQGLTHMIDTIAGSIVIYGLAVAFLLVAAAPFFPPSPILAGLLKGLRWISKPFGWIASWIDALLVFPLAGTLGANQSQFGPRYLLLLGNILPCAALGWWLPPPYGLGALIFALIGAIAIARRWAWIEEDRENAMLNRKFDGPHLRVGFDQDLRDETLVAFMTLLFLVPLALRQLYLMLGPDTFAIAEASDVNDPLAWFTFFGTELAKALPFVDWAEVYHVEGNAAIHLDPDRITNGNHVIFASRILVDLILLAAFLQAISITQRTKKLRDMFFVDQTIDQLDPFIEPSAFRKLVRSGPDGFELIDPEVNKFPRYNEDRLERLKQLGDKDELGFVAKRLLDRYHAGGPEDQILGQAKRPVPSREKCDELIDALQNVAEVQVGTLKAAHYELNAKSAFWYVRQQIAELIARHIDDPAAINALSEILIGPGPGVADPRQEGRYAALMGLYKPALMGNVVARASISRAAHHDGAIRVLEEAQRIEREFGGPAPS